MAQKFKGRESSEAESATDRESGISDVSIQHLELGNEVMSSEEVLRASDEMDKKGVDRPIREGLDLDVDDVPQMIGDSDDEEEKGRRGFRD